MGWYYRRPQAFPTFYYVMVRKAIAAAGERIVFDSSIRRDTLATTAEKIRWLKWCAKQEPGADRELSLLFEAYDVRTSIEQDEIGYVMYMSARPTKLSEFIRLNPKLATEMLSQCQ